MVVSAAYRVRQFVEALLARVSADELQQADAVLPPGARRLFRQMAVPDQRHALNVMRTLRRQGYAQPELLAAALLHDAGKSATRIQPWHRAIIVLSKHWAPGLLAWLSKGEPQGWRKPFVIQKLHPEIGAQWAARAGCEPSTVELIRRHQESRAPAPLDREGELLAALQHADNWN